MKRKDPHNGHETTSTIKRRKTTTTVGLKQKRGKNSKWYKGKLCPIKNPKAWFIRPETELPHDYCKSKDVFMYPNYVSDHVLPIREGDILEFILGDRDKARPMAIKVQVFQYLPRTCQELIDYIRKLTNDVKEVLVQVLPYNAMWRFLGSPEFKKGTDLKMASITYIGLLLNLLKEILHHGRSYKALLEVAIKNVTQGKIFQATNNHGLPAIIKTCSYENNELFYSEEPKTSLSTNLIQRFCVDAIRQFPFVTRYLLPTVVAISERISNPTTQIFLCDILKLNFSGESGFSVSSDAWKELSLIPTEQELGGQLVEEDKYLSRVRFNYPYDNSEQYMDTYFRLMRAETFSAIQHGIKDLKASTLDLRDMNVYYNVKLAGFKLQGGRFSLAIHFTPTKNVKKWEASPQLMYGNLVCISINRKFDDVIWATVSNRDTFVLNKYRIITLELLDENVKSISEIINSLLTQGGSAVMVESPNYYHSLSPILRSLKEFEMENFPLQNEIIYAKHSLDLPEYLKEATIETSIVCSYKEAKTRDDPPEKQQNVDNMMDTSEGEKIEEVNGLVQSVDVMSIDQSVNHNRTSSLQIDTTNIPNNSLHPKSKQRECIDDKWNKFMPTSPNVLEPGEISSQEELGVRMNVERFLEKFNSSLESSLEASQCDALVHALKNKLAIIQGPPGCGKTYIGVKIVQLLLSLAPKLEKPILLLTYKNHALDEFLKHMLEFCEKEDLVRIGGRSKEPKLEYCNLKYIQNSIPYVPETNREINKKKLEISAVESKIEEISKKVQDSSFLTMIGFVAELTEEQVRSFIIEAGWGSKPMFYRLGGRCNARKTTIKELLDNISKKWGSVTDFLHRALKVGISGDNRDGNDCIKVFKKAFQHWYPGRRELQTMKKFQTEFVLQVETCAKKSKDEDEDDDSGDEDYVNQLLETRMAAGEIEGVRSDDHTLFDFLDDNKKDILVKISDYPPDMVVDSQIRSVQNLWTLDDIEKLKFLYRILYDKTQKSSQELNDLLKELQSLKKRREELEITDKVKFLSQKKIIGVTITGASINHDLLHHIGPSVVIVEEAAEILEPSLLAALTTSIEHLILIGDHKQLRPQVDTYELSKNFNLDVSMMERLIESGYPFKSLAKQNRMRPEFSALLHDIYPNLEDNLPLVLKNEPLRCIEKSMFFWCHEEPEKQDRTYSNLKEAGRVIAIVLYLLWNGVPTSDITVLAAYLGQTKLLRNMIKEVKKRLPHFFQRTSEHGSEQDGFIQVQTIDMYQGDENKYVIVSLVRSNKENRIGFLKKMNRRCVAQSRAKCGMYFVGNRNTLCGAKNSCWSELINLMMKEDCVGYDFPLRCTKHETSIYKAMDDKSIWEVIKNPTLLCQQECGDFYLRCDQHPCGKTCFPLHEHNECPEILDDQFPDCGHYVKRKCAMNILYLSCVEIVSVDLPCGHTGTKACSQDVSAVICREKVIKTFPRCGHTTEVACRVKIETTICKQRCEEKNSCGIHRCSRSCGEAHGHDTCKKKIDYNFPNCGHPSLKKKECSQAITWNCKYKVIFKGSCGHEIQKECHQSEGEVKCPITPCERLRKCGHPCPNSCGDDCEKGECEHCLRVYRKKMEESRDIAKKRVKELEEKIKAQDIPNFSLHELQSTGLTAVEYQTVKDQVIKFIKPCHQWFPTITKIERVTNLELEKKFELAKSKAFGDHIDTKFHGTSNNDLTKTIKKGFKMPEDNPVPPKTRGVYGQGIYFATDPSIYARDIYAEGSQKLLLCQVILGKSLTVEEADDTLNRTKLQDEKCDSVYAPQGTKVMFEEFVIFNPHQALPRYIIHFSSTNKLVPPSPNSLTTENYFIKNMQASRSINFQDPFEMYYNFAESHFRRMAAKTGIQVTISSIDIVVNKDLEDKFEETRRKFKNEGTPDHEILAYHGTDKKNIESILKSNLQLSYAKRQLYGKGNYFSEFPAVSFDYGDGLLLCRVLPGKEYVDSTNCDIPTGFNSKKVLKSQITGTSAANASGEMIIIENSDQILPFFVIHR